MADDIPTQSIIVFSEIDERKFKMVMKGDLSNLAVDKIKRYLQKSTGMDPRDQLLTYNGLVLTEDMVGMDFDLRPNTTIRLSRSNPEPPAAPTVIAPSSLVDGGGGGYATSPSLNSRGGLAEDTEGRKRMQQYEHDHQRASMMTTSSPQNLAGESLFDRAARMQQRSPGGYSSAQNHHAPSSSSSNQQQQQQQQAPHPSTAKMNVLEDDNKALRAEVDQLKRELLVAGQLKPTSNQQLITHAKNMLSELGKELGMHLAFDTNLTCVVGSDERNAMIVTCDIPTERLYLYSTLSASIPENPQLRLQLYETLLEGAMLGRDMAGGGCGITMETGLVMMSTSIDLRHTDVTALRSTAPIFVESLVRWRNVVEDILQSAHHPTRAPPPPPHGQHY